MIVKQPSDENIQFNQLGYFRHLIGLEQQSNLVLNLKCSSFNNTSVLLLRKLAEDHTQFVGNVFTKHQEASMQLR